jgi:hypothetical protein
VGDRLSFRDYLIHGWKLCAIAPGFKGPTGSAAKGWNLPGNAITDPNRGPSLAGAGLLHTWSGTCAFDIDNMEVACAWLDKEGVDIEALLTARDAVQISSGREGRAKLLYRLPAPLASLKLAPYQSEDKQKTWHGFELRCATAEGFTVQDVLPPTIHPTTGRPYEWRYGDDLFGHWSNPPMIPDVLLALWKRELSGQKPAAAEPGTLQAPVGAEFDEIRKVLEQYNPDDDHNEWVKIGMAIHHETGGSQAGLALWDEWSRKGSKYGERKGDQPAQYPKDKWRTFKTDGTNPITFASLRRGAVAQVEEFPIVAPTEHQAVDEGTDTRPAAVIKRILESRLVFVSGQSAYFDLQSNSGELLSDYTVKHVFCPKLPTIVTDTPKGPKYTKIDPIDFLRESQTKEIVSSIGLHPGAARFYEEDGRRFVNRYTPRPVPLLRPTPRELEAFNFIWNRITDPVFRNWLMKFFAHALQKPGVKIRSAPLLWSTETGTGKNTIMRIIPGLLYGEQWIGEMSSSVLGSQFNDQLGETWWLYLEELRAGSTKVDRVMMANRLKSWITDDTIQIHPKGRKPYWLRNRLQVIATSNFDDAVQIENTDRRWAIGEMQGDALTEAESLNLYHDFLQTDRAAGVLRYIFSHADITGFNPAARAPATEAKTVMIQAGLGQWESALLAKMAAGEAPFNRDMFYMSDVLQYVGGHGLTLHRLARLLQRAPFHCQKFPKVGGDRLWSWRNHDQWAQYGGATRAEYMSAGTRPVGPEWSDALPKSIAEMAPDAEDQDVAISTKIPDSCAGLF